MITTAEHCTGCGACFCVCPQRCITIEKNEQGFCVPIVLEEKCVHCGLCEKVCPAIHPIDTSGVNRALAAMNCDTGVREKSSSGGVFPALAHFVLQQQGYVCAAVYDESFAVKHVLTNEADWISDMCGAKYAQSDAFVCFQEIEEKLKQDKMVLFVGTPCQVSGLKGFLRRSYERLITVDMVCHGVPSPMIWEHYVRDRKRTDAKRFALRKVELRNKETGWSRYQHSVKFTYEKDRVYAMPQGLDRFSRGFVEGLYLRESCYHCQYKETARCSDITLGDYWGVWDQMPEYDDNRGTSLITIHTPSGEAVWNSVKEQFKYTDVELGEAIRQNKSMTQSTMPHPAREPFWAEHDQTKSVIALIEKHMGLPPIEKNTFWAKVSRKVFGR